MMADDTPERSRRNDHTEDRSPFHRIDDAELIRAAWSSG
jgi:hypothetical protein